MSLSNMCGPMAIPVFEGPNHRPMCRLLSPMSDDWLEDLASPHSSVVELLQLALAIATFATPIVTRCPVSKECCNEKHDIHDMKRFGN
jgi:hypothetical protein